MAHVIELESITKFFGSVRALADVTLSVDSGVTGLLGPNGAGKSTLIKILLGLLRASGGRGTLLGFELGRQNRWIRASVGYMPEDDCYLPGLTGVESVQLAARLSRLPAIEALRRAHEILDFAGIAQERYRRVETYSTGMRQKLRFAQAIVHDPPLLILDEPTSGLDPEEREAMLSRVRVLAQRHGKAIILCTHILPDVQSVSDAVVILARGQVKVADRLEQLSRPASPSIHVRLSGQSELFAERLTRRGIDVEQESDGSLRLLADGHDVTSLIWDVARECRTGIRSLRPSRNSLEEVFLNAVASQQGTEPEEVA